MFSLANKRFLVTGASSGIGRQIAIAITEFGGTVVCLGRNLDRLKETQSLLKGEGHSTLSFDLNDSIEIKQFITISGNFDGVVFNAGIIDYTPVKFINDEKILSLFNTNFNSVVRLSQQLVKNKRLIKNGSLVFVSSISSILGVQGTALYASSKAALKAYTRVIASELANQKIRANSISPGIVISPMTDSAIEVTSNEVISNSEKEYPLGFGKPKDIAGLAIYLLSDASKWMTGTDLVIDGGLTLK